MGTAPLHDAYSASESAPRTSLSFSHQNKGSVVRPLTYASMAVGSWSDKAKRCGTAASQTSTSQVQLASQAWLHALQHQRMLMKANASIV